MKLILLPGVLLPALLLSPSSWACGGFFCSTTPVLQARERVVFEVSGDQTTAYVQIFYSGNDRDFAWIVPVPSTPEVTVGVGDRMFEALESQTRPVVVSPTGASSVAALDAPAGCGDFGGSTGPRPVANSGPPQLNLRSVAKPEVTIWQAEQVGPYEHVTLSAQNASDLNTWLALNGYRVQPGADPIVQSYLDQGMKLLALKLRPEATASAIEPVRLVYQSEQGCVLPLRLTSVAAVPNMEVVVWVFGSAPAAPVNVPSVEVDLVGLQTTAQYESALPGAIDAGGDGFAVEFAQPNHRLSGQGDPELTALLERNAYVTRLRSFLDPEEMKVDPDFQVDHRLPEVSNVIVSGVRSAGLSWLSASLWAFFFVIPALRRKQQ